MQFPRRWLAPAVVAFSAAGFAGAQIATGNYGVKISELVHGPSQPTVGGLPVPTYVELVNVQIANPVVPQPMQLTGATLAISVNGSVGVFTFPAANAANVPSLLGGNVQPVPAAQPAVPPTEPPVCIVANGPLPTTMLPPGALVFVAPGLFAGPRAAFASVGVATEVCLQVPAFPPGPAPFLLPQPPVHDRMAIPPATAQLLCGATPSPFTQTNGWSNVNGRVSRWLYMDSNTDLDFDAIFPISPGVVNPEMAHVDGFTFGPPAPVGTPHPNPLLGAPLVFAGSATGTISAPPAVVTGVKFKSPVGASIPNDRLITAPVFDRTIGAAVTINGAFVSQGPSFGTLPGYLSGLAPAGITTTIVVPPTSTGGPPGVLTLPSGPSSLAFPPDAQPTPLNPTQFRIRRVFTDGIPDSGTSGTGDTSAAMDDTIPGSTGGGNVWCDPAASLRRLTRTTTACRRPGIDARSGPDRYPRTGGRRAPRTAGMRRRGAARHVAGSRRARKGAGAETRRGRRSPETPSTRDGSPTPCRAAPRRRIPAVRNGTTSVAAGRDGDGRQGRAAESYASELGALRGQGHARRPRGTRQTRARRRARRRRGRTSRRDAARPRRAADGRRRSRRAGGERARRRARTLIAFRRPGRG
jgi:hypothetical protein